MTFNSCKTKFLSKSGLTLVELILSIAIIGIIAISFMPLFIMSTQTNNKSEMALDSTYLGKDAVELVYNLSKTIPYGNLGSELENRGYVKSETNSYSYEHADKRYLNIIFAKEGNLVRLNVKVYKDRSMNSIEAQYETLLSW